MQKKTKWNNSLLLITAFCALFSPNKVSADVGTPIGLNFENPFKRDSTKKEPKVYNFIGFRYHGGYVLPTNEFIRGENMRNEPIHFYQSGTAYYGVQTTGKKEWHHALNFPYYGVGFYNASFFNTSELGYPTALYGFIGIPIRRGTNWSWGYELGFGFTYNWRPYDPYNNPFNVAIGSHHTVFIDANLYYDRALSSRWHVKGGLGFSHFSNGATKQPNSGINLLSPFVEVRYMLKDEPVLDRKPVADYLKSYEVAIQVGAGNKEEMYHSKENDDLYTTTDFELINLSVAYLKQTTWKNKYGAGFDLSYDSEQNVEVTQRPGNAPLVSVSDQLSDKMMLGLFGTYEFCIDRLSIASYLGYKVLRKTNSDSGSGLYQKFGIKYHFKNNFYVGILVRAHNFTVADYIEWNVGYRIKWF